MRKTFSDLAGWIAPHESLCRRRPAPGPCLAFSWLRFACTLLFVLACLGSLAQSGRAQVTVTVSPNTVTLATGHQQMFSASVTVTDAEFSGDESYQWYLDGLDSAHLIPGATAQTYSYSSATAGSHILYCWVVSYAPDGSGHSYAAYDFATITVSSPGVTLTSASGAPNPATTEDTVQFTANASENTGSGAISYAWNFGDGSTSGSGQFPTHHYTGAGSFPVTVTATDAANHSATRSFTETVVTPPSGPTNLTATPGNARVDLTWTARAGAAYYILYRGTSSGGEAIFWYLPSTNTSFTDTYVTNGQVYFYELRAAVSSVNSALSNEAHATPSAPPVAPANLTAVPGNAQVVLTWTASTGATSYNLYRGTSAGGEAATPIATGLTGTSYPDTGRTNGQIYYYKLKAVNAGGSNAFSNEASATPANPPAPGKVRFYPLPGYAYRMTGGKFQGSHDGSTYTDLYTIASPPADLQWTEASLTTDPKNFRFLRYLSPNGSYASVAEIEFYSGIGTSAVKLTGIPFGSPGSYNNGDYKFIRALDGDISTAFVGPGPDGNFVGIDQPGPQLTLTPAGVQAGFTLTTFATGFPLGMPDQQAVGPMGTTFPGTGVLVSDVSGNVRLFPTDTDNQVAGNAPPSITPAANLGFANATGLAMSGGTVYLAQPGNGQVIRLNADGTPMSGPSAIVATIPDAGGISTNPVSGHLFVSTFVSGGQIWDVDPFTNSAVLWPFVVPYPDGVAVSADGATLYVAQHSPDGVVAYDIARRVKIWDYNTANPATPIAAIDGIALGSGGLSGMLYANTNDGTVWQIAVPSGAATEIASGGTRGDFVGADPHGQGSLLLTQTDRIMRLSPFPSSGSGSLALTSLTLNPTSVTGGQASVGMVTLTGNAPLGGIRVSLSSNNADVSVPRSVTVPAGQASVTFPIITVSVASNTAASLSASLSGVTKSETLTVLASLSLGLTLDPISVLGTHSSTATITLSAAAPVGGLLFDLSSSDPAATVPATKTVDAGSTTATFTVQTAGVSAVKTAVIKAAEAGITATGTVLDTQTVSSFIGGKYLFWNIQGHVKIKITTLAGPNAVLSGLFFDAPGTFAAPSVVTNGSFETPSIPVETVAAAPPESGWTFSGYAGITPNGSAYTAGNPPAPDGGQVALLQMTGSFSQSVTMAAGTYAVSFAAAQRGNWNFGGQDFQVLVDGNVVGTFRPANTYYAAYTSASFTVAAGNHTIQFQGLDTTGGDNTAFIDQVQIVTATPVVTNGSFETPSVGPAGQYGGFQYNPTGAGWTFSGSAGIAANSSAFTSGNFSAPDANQVAFLQGIGSFSQSVTMAAGTYAVSFAAAQRGNVNNGGQDFQVLVDGTVVGIIRPSNASYASYTTFSFTVTAGSHTIQFQGLDTTGGDNTALIDQVQIVTASPPANAGSAAFVGTDTHSRGTWKGAYGLDGYSLAQDSQRLPAYAAVSATGQSDYTWLASTSDTRALQKPASATDRLAACWFSGTSFTFDVNLTDGQTHQIGLYCLDWDASQRVQKIEILDATVPSGVSAAATLAINPPAIHPPDCEAAPLSSLTVSSDSLSSGQSLTGTVTLSGAALPGGEVVNLSCDPPSALNLPPSVQILAGDNTANFTATVRSMASGPPVAITATFHNTSKTVSITVNPDGMSLTPQALAEGLQLTTFVSGFASTNGIGPLGIALAPDGGVFVTDIFGTLYKFAQDVDGQTASQAVLTGIANSRFSALATGAGSVYEGGRYPQEIVELNLDGTTKRVVTTGQQFLAWGIAFNPRTGHLLCGGADIDPITGAVRTLAAAARGDTTAVSADGSTVFNSWYDSEGNDAILGYDIALGSPTLGAQVFSIPIPGVDGCTIGSGSFKNYLFGNTIYGKLVQFDMNTGESVDLATGGSRGDFIGYGSNGTLYITQSDRILRLIPPAGASFGLGKSQSIYTRDDLTHSYDGLTHSTAAISLSQSQTTADSAKAASFDTSAVSGTVTAARMQRAGRINGSGPQFDLQLGIRSLLFHALPAGYIASYAPTLEAAQTLPSPYDYLPVWNLPSEFLSDIQTQIGNEYRVALTDQISSLCGTNTVLDTPHQGWPIAKNILTFTTDGAANPQIPQGRSLDISVADQATSGLNAPAFGTWDVLLGGMVVASSGNPAGWYVEDDHTYFGGLTVTVPPSAVAARDYQVRFSGQAAGASRFDVVPAGSIRTAAILQPMTLSAAHVVGGTSGQATLTIQLDAPAPHGGATVTLTSDNPVAAFSSASVFIPAGQTTPPNPVTVTTSAVASPVPVPLHASYNGYRVASLAVLDPSGGPPLAPLGLTATPGDAQVTLSWGTLSGATSYTLKRSTVSGGPYAVLFAGLTSPGYTDQAVVNGKTYYYVVSASNIYGEGLNSTPAAATPQGVPVATPTFSSHPSPGSTQVAISEATPGAFIHYTQDGTMPTEASPVYRSPLTLYSTTTVQARAFKAGHPPSGVASETFPVTSGNPNATTAALCGARLSDVLAATDPISAESGSPAKFYTYQGVAGETITVTATSASFIPGVILHSPTGDVVVPTGSNSAPQSQFTYTFPSDGPYAIEVTSTGNGNAGTTTGPFTLTVDCGIALTGFTLTPSTVTGGSTSAATVFLSQSAPVGGVQVALASNASAATVPATVIVPAGQSQLTVPVATAPVSSGVVATLTATLAATTLTQTLTVNPPGTPPTVAITHPTSPSAPFAAPGPIPITVSAAASGGATIASVTVFADSSVLVGSVTSSPYTFSWTDVAPGTYSLTARATDSRGLVATSAPVSVTVSPAGQVALPVISPGGGIFASTQSVTITDATPGASIYYTLDGTDPAPTPDLLYSGAFPLFSQTQVKAKAFLANYTPSATASASFTFSPGSNSDPAPSVQILSPADGATVTGPTPVTGTVTIGSLAAWQLSYRLVSQGTDASGNPLDASSPWVPIAAGTSSVTSQVLGTLDTTLLLNGLYEIRLMAEDNNGQTAVDVKQVSVTGNQKVGYFTFAYTDLTLPAAGLPIQVTRTYDSRDKTPGDFGIGWKLGLTNIRLQKDGAIGDGWSNAVMPGFFPLYDVAPLRSHMVTITFPTGECFRFEASLPQGSQFVEPPQGSDVQYTPLPGTKGSLTIVGAHSVIIPPGFPQASVQLLDADSDDIVTFDRSEFILTTRDGRQFDLDQFKGLLSVTDRNGNTLTFNHSGNAVTGITSTSLDASGNAVTGRGVSFIRSGTGNYITQIGDLNGQALHYGQTGDDLTSFTDRSNNTTHYDYDGSHNVTAIHDPRGLLPLRNEYDAAGRLLDTLDAHGHKITYGYNLSVRQETVTDRLGHPTLIGYDAYGNVTSKTQYLLDGQGSVQRTITTQSLFDTNNPNNPDKPIQTIDALGNETDFQYDSDGNLTSATQYLPDADGNLQPVTTQTTYNASGQPLTVTDAEGKVVTTNTYDGSGNLTATRDALGNETDFAYNANGTLQSTRDALGHVTTYAYDPSRTSDVTMVTDAKNHSTNFTYDADGNKKSQATTRTNAQGQPEMLTTTFDYDASGRLQKTTYPDGATSQTFYNSLGKVDYTLDAQGRKTQYAYDDFGQLTSTTYPDGMTSGTTYDTGGQALTRTDKGGRISGSVYDSLGRVVASGAVDAQGNFLTDSSGHPIFSGTTYDDAGQVTAQADERGNVTLLAYDALGRKTSETDALHHVTRYDYDLDGRQVSVLDAKGHQTTYDYDDAGRLLVTHYHDGSTSTTGYDALGRRTDQTDQASHTTHYDYDELGRLWKVTDAMSHVTTFGYDELGEKVSQTDANNHVTRFAYDNRGRLIQKLLPLGQSEAMDYTAPGGQLWHKYVLNANGQPVRTTTFSYEATTSRLSSKSGTDEDSLSDTISYWYNPDGSRSQVQRVRGATSVTTTYGYYPSGGFQQGQLQTVQTVSGALTLGPITYTYDAAGNKLTAQTPSGTTTYGYDALNRLSQVTHRDSALTKFTYDAVGNRATQVRQAPGSPLVSSITTTYGYDALNRLTALVNTQGGATLSSYGYTLYPDGKRHTLTDNVAGTTTTYSYFDAGWLKEENGPQGDVQYTYDNVGNRQTKSLTGTGTQTYLYDNNDRLSSESGYLGGVSYGHDDAGNMTGVGTQTYTYDFENRLLSVTQGGSPVTTNLYDGDGNRIGKADSTGTVNYLVDVSLPYASVVEERDNSNNLLARYDYGDDLVRMDRAGGVYYYLYDGLGSTRQLVSASGAVTDRYGYDAFGIPSHTLGSALNPFQFNGQQYDGALGLYFLRARYYAPTEGRFLSQDPYSGSNEDPISLHRYLYAGVDPVDMIDPGGQDFSLSGLAVTVAIGSTIGAISGAASSYALTGAVQTADVVQGAVFGALLAPVAVAIPAVGVGLGLAGLASSGLVAYQVFTDPGASTSRKITALGLVIASIYGAKQGFDFYKISRGFEPNATITLNRIFLATTISKGSAIEAITTHLSRFPEQYPGDSIDDLVYRPDQEMLARFKAGNTDKITMNWARHELAEIAMVESFSEAGSDFLTAAMDAHARVVAHEQSLGLTQEDRYTTDIIAKYSDQF